MGLGEVWGVAKKGRGGPQSDINFLQGGDTGDTPIWLVDLGTFGGSTHTMFLRHITGKQERQQADGTWAITSEELVREAA